MKPTDFAMYVTAFLTNYLPAQRNAVAGTPLPFPIGARLD